MNTSQVNPILMHMALLKEAYKKNHESKTFVFISSSELIFIHSLCLFWKENTKYNSSFNRM